MESIKQIVFEFSFFLSYPQTDLDQLTKYITRYRLIYKNDDYLLVCLTEVNFTLYA